MSEWPWQCVVVAVVGGFFCLLAAACFVGAFIHTGMGEE